MEIKFSIFYFVHLKQSNAKLNMFVALNFNDLFSFFSKRVRFKKFKKTDDNDDDHKGSEMELCPPDVIERNHIRCYKVLCEVNLS